MSYVGTIANRNSTSTTGESEDQGAEQQNTSTTYIGTMADPDQPWHQDKSMLSCNKYMFENSLATDVTFSVRDILYPAKTSPGEEAKESQGRMIDAHKYVLMARSPVFWKMFAEDKVNKMPIVVNDAHPDAFYQMLLFMYTDEVNIKPELVMFILHLSKKYAITLLENQCIDYLKNNMKVTNACIFLDHGNFFKHDELSMSCLRLIANDTTGAFASPTFLEIRQETLGCILSLDVLSIPEIEVFKSVLTWTKHTCTGCQMEITSGNLRKILGEVLGKIHFPVMSMAEFGQVAAPTDILPIEHENNIFRYLSAGNNLAKSPAPYSCHVRYHLTGDHTEKAHANLSQTEEVSGNTFTSEYVLDTETDIQVREVTIPRDAATTEDVSYNLKLWFDENLVGEATATVLAEDPPKASVSLSSVKVTKGKHNIKVELKCEKAGSVFDVALRLATKGKIEHADKKMKWSLCSADDKPSLVMGIACWVVYPTAPDQNQPNPQEQTTPPDQNQPNPQEQTSPPDQNQPNPQEQTIPPDQNQPNPQEQTSPPDQNQPNPQDQNQPNPQEQTTPPDQNQPNPQEQTSPPDQNQPNPQEQTTPPDQPAA